MSTNDAFVLSNSDDEMELYPDLSMLCTVTTDLTAEQSEDIPVDDEETELLLGLSMLWNVTRDLSPESPEDTHVDDDETELLLGQSTLRNVTRYLSPEPQEDTNVEEHYYHLPLQIGILYRRFYTSEVNDICFDGFTPLPMDDVSQSLNTFRYYSPSPLSKEEINMLPTVRLTKEHLKEDLQCSICIKNFREDCQVKQVPCNHYFHAECIIPWLRKQATCPNCRKTIKVKSTVPKSRIKCRKRLRNNERSRFTDAPSNEDYFTTSVNPFRYID